MTNQPAWCAACTARAFASVGISCCSSRMPGPSVSASARSTSTASTSMLAPEITTIVLAPVASMVISAVPVGLATFVTCCVSTPASRSPASRVAPKASRPTQPAMPTRAPSLAAATAWLAPLPPGAVKKPPPMIVWPRSGKRSQRATRSMFRLPITRIGLTLSDMRLHRRCLSRGGKFSAFAWWEHADGGPIER